MTVMTRVYERSNRLSVLDSLTYLKARSRSFQHTISATSKKKIIFKRGITVSHVSIIEYLVQRNRHIFQKNMSDYNHYIQDHMPFPSSLYCCTSALLGCLRKLLTVQSTMGMMTICAFCHSFKLTLNSLHITSILGKMSLSSLGFRLNNTKLPS